MMQQVNRMRNLANTYYLVKTIDDDEAFEYVERFELNWDLYKGGVLSDAAKANVHLFVTFIVIV